MVNWDGLGDSLLHIGNSASSVFLFKNIQGGNNILKITDANFRSKHEVMAETAFIRYLYSAGCVVNKVVLSASNDAVIEYQDQQLNNYYATSYSYFGKSLAFDFSSNAMNDWGEALGKIHQQSKLLNHQGKQLELWHWNEEIIFKAASTLIPNSDKAIKNKIFSIFKNTEKIKHTKDNYGIIHGDLGPRNFRYDKTKREIQIFDFGNSCYHYYFYDISVVLGIIERQNNTAENKKHFLKGYQKISPIPVNFDYLLQTMSKLRDVYVYLDRLYVLNINSLQHDKIERLNQIKNNLLLGKNWWSKAE
ncbi:MAG: phosphotransferase enzyme family protein [Lewinella sp.]